MTPTVAKDATCTEAGNSAYYTCGNCNKVFKDEQGNDETSVEEATIAALGHLPGNDTTVTWTGDTAKIAFTCQREGCGLAVNEDAEVTAEDNILIASYNGVAYDKKHKDSTTTVGAVGTVKDENGQEIAAAAVTAEEITDTDLPDNNLLDPQKAAAVEGEHTADQMDVVWQKEVKVAGTTGPVTMTFTVSGVGSTQKIFVFHFTAGAWKIEAEGEEGAGSVTVTLGDLSPIALVVASTAPPATGDSSSTFIWAGAMVMAACAAAYVVMTSKRGKHEA